MFYTFCQEITDCLENMGCMNVDIMEEASPQFDKDGDYVLQVYCLHPRFPQGLMIQVYGFSDGYSTTYDGFYVQPQNSNGIQTVRESVYAANWEKLMEMLDSGMLKDSQD